MGANPDIDGFFDGRHLAASLFRSVCEAVEAAGPSTIRVTKSQIAFSTRRAFAWVWTPDRYLRSPTLAPLVLSVALPRRDGSTRWKEVVEPSPGRWVHHLEIFRAEDIDVEVLAWLSEARAAAS